MSATSIAQRRLFGIARGVQKGDKPAGEAGVDARRIARGVSPKKVDHFAKTKESGLPQRKTESAANQLIRRALDERDDIDKLNLPPESKSYARMTSKDVMSQPGGTSRKWFKSLNLRKAITNQKGIKGFPSMDKSVQIKVKEHAQRVVTKLLDQP
jgi:hypothetical protein